MQSVLLTVSEFASISNQNQLNINSIFDVIEADEFPTVIPRLVVSIQFRARPDEYNRGYDLQLILLTPDEKLMVDFTGSGIVPEYPHGVSVLISQVITLRNLNFRKPGTYRFEVNLNGIHVSSAPLTLIEVKEESTQPEASIEN